MIELNCYRCHFSVNLSKKGKGFTFCVEEVCLHMPCNWDKTIGILYILMVLITSNINQSGCVTPIIANPISKSGPLYFLMVLVVKICFNYHVVSFSGQSSEF